LCAIEVDTSQIALSLHVGELRSFLASIEFDQNISLMHPLPGFKVNLVDRTGQIGAHGYALNGCRRTDYR
jgi:hypothetical protein